MQLLLKYIYTYIYLSFHTTVRMLFAFFSYFICCQITQIDNEKLLYKREEKRREEVGELCATI